MRSHFAGQYLDLKKACRSHISDTLNVLSSNTCALLSFSHVFQSLLEKRVAPAGGFQGLWGGVLTRRDSSLKRLQKSDGKEFPQNIEDHLENSINQ